ncbi:hypothetical protein RIR_jg27990.t1 [Rhizophagus irregularis DAOM 181602=DAOM 197198]|nr:hypothetical protein RIR_jg27990.t1 [Rhizophagus irregularis DAOM 181602=DAOM 197198]
MKIAWNECGHKDYTDKKRNERETRRNERETKRIDDHNDQFQKNEEKYLHMKSKYWDVCWLMKRFQAIYIMKHFNYLELNEIRKGSGIIVLIKNKIN